jgi:hypothetical protein
LDDVDSEDQLKVLPKLGELGDGSNFIITTRDRDLLKYFANCCIYEVQFLDFAEAKKLLCHHLFKGESVLDDLTKIYPYLDENVKKVVQKCDGLPLSLEIMGCHLKDQESDPKAWEQAIIMLSEAQSIAGTRKDRLWTCLRLSYDSLDDKQQQMFLEAATYYFQKRVDRVFCAWSTAYTNLETIWSNLLKKSLVKEVSTEFSTPKVVSPDFKMKWKTIWVHEQLRDLAKDLSKREIISQNVQCGDLQIEPNMVST